MTTKPEIDALNQRIAELEAELEQANKERKPSIHKLVELLKECKVEPRFDFEKYPYLYGGSCVPPEEQVGELPYCGDPNCPDCQDKQMEKEGLKFNLEPQWRYPLRVGNPEKEGWYWIKWGPDSKPRVEEWDGEYWESSGDHAWNPYAYYPHPIPEPPEMT